MRQSFEVAAARTSGLVNLVFSRQTGFLCATIRLYVHNRARCTKRMDIRPGFEAVSEQHASIEPSVSKLLVCQLNVCSFTRVLSKKVFIRQVNLRGPESPIEMSFYSITNIGRLR